MAISKKQRFEIFKRDGFVCQYCGRKPPEIVLELDHIMSRKRKGKDEPENLITACFDCNRGKGSRDLKVAPDSIKKKKEVLKEKREQLKEFHKLQEEIQNAILEDVIKLAIHWEELSQNKEELTAAGKRNIKHLLRTFTFYEIQEAMEIAWQKLNLDDRFAYTCGILWTQKKQREET